MRRARPRPRHTLTLASSLSRAQKVKHAGICAAVRRSSHASSAHVTHRPAVTKSVMSSLGGRRSMTRAARATARAALALLAMAGCAGGLVLPASCAPRAHRAVRGVRAVCAAADDARGARPPPPAPRPRRRDRLMHWLRLRVSPPAEALPAEPARARRLRKRDRLLALLGLRPRSEQGIDGQAPVEDLPLSVLAAAAAAASGSPQVLLSTLVFDAMAELSTQDGQTPLAFEGRSVPAQASAFVACKCFADVGACVHTKHTGTHRHACLQ